MFAFLTVSAFSFCNSSCAKEEGTSFQNNGTDVNNEISDTTGNKMKMTVGTREFTVSLSDNATVKNFKTMLPLEIVMEDLNSNEKYFYFSNQLPTSSAPGGNIQSGDLMLYSNNCLVLFYENFNTSYSYTRLGKADNINGLKSALGAGSVKVKFELQ